MLLSKELDVQVIYNCAVAGVFFFGVFCGTLIQTRNMQSLIQQQKDVKITIFDSFPSPFFLKDQKSLPGAAIILDEKNTSTTI